jgi:ferredoxin
MPAYVDLERCDGCGNCVDACPTESISLVEGKASVDPDDCIDCWSCIDACPNDAIEIAEERHATG